eukprot:Hpha_TRINITY_DN26829_c0_g1::TRINITY_DN26829_c0_g1_i1::g.17316::m.17316/K03145/TFIIS; transcription elongation factor S-II
MSGPSPSELSAFLQGAGPGVKRASPSPPAPRREPRLRELLSPSPLPPKRSRRRRERSSSGEAPPQRVVEGLRGNARGHSARAAAVRMPCVTVHDGPPLGLPLGSPPSLASSDAALRTAFAGALRRLKCEPAPELVGAAERVYKALSAATGRAALGDRPSEAALRGIACRIVGVIGKNSRGRGVPKTQLAVLLGTLSRDDQLAVRLCRGEMKPEEAAVASPEQLAGAEHRNKLTAARKQAAVECTVDTDADATVSDLFKCVSCGNRRCSYQQLQVCETAYLTTFVRCHDCGHTWK